MATAVEFRSPADAFPLGSVFETLPGSTVELERLVARETRIIPYLWVRGTTADDIEVAFTTHAGLTDIRLVDSVEDEYLLRAEWDRAHVFCRRSCSPTSGATSSHPGVDTRGGCGPPRYHTVVSFLATPARPPQTRRCDAHRVTIQVVPEEYPHFSTSMSNSPSVIAVMLVPTSFADRPRSSAMSLDLK